ncbi:MAG: glycosyltransferase [Canidatus Methanoxibalbensis ujae]|nr:glycosyltransferase [Candidatus Methanoxibalbensis ujae]MCW7079407.1 glycosyltransferase [Candidatus Methanoxibalbensis ujae]
MYSISVVIPTYNEELFIGRCLGSLMNQTLPRSSYEIIVVDGGSDDRTVEIASRYADKIIKQRSKFVGGARNEGVMAAESDIIATTDADIILPRKWLERIIHDFRDDVVAVYGPIEPIECHLKYRIMLEMFNILSHAANKIHIYTTVGANTAFRRDKFFEVGGYPEVPAGDDYSIAMKLHRVGRIYYDRELRVLFSMRRMEKFGVLRALLMWAENAWAAKRGRSPRRNYTMQLYR